MVTLQVICTDTSCQDTETNQEMKTIEDNRWIWLMSKQEKRDLAKLRTAQWDSDMFQQWITYSVEAVHKAQKKQTRVYCMLQCQKNTTVHATARNSQR